MNPSLEPESNKWIALVGGRLIDGHGGAPIEDAVVVIRGTEIIAAGPGNVTAIPDTAEKIDVGGLSILPGLIDTHFHSRDTDVTPVEFELKKGITSFRDPGHPFKYYDVALNSDKTMPRIFLCGGHLDGSPPVWPDQAEVIKDTEDAWTTVNAHVDRGASAIKVYLRLPLELITSACQAAHERNVIVTAHLELVDADDAIRAGVRGIEHVSSFGTTLADAGDVAYFKKEIHADSNARKKLRPWLWSRIDLRHSTRLEPLLDLMVETGTFASPTLDIFEARTGEKNATEEEVRGFETMLQFTKLCHEAGIKIVVGSHTSAPFADRGFAFQREMELLGEAGLAPLEILTAATKTGAEFLGIEERLGTIEKGKTADLVLVEGNPAKDIGAMRNVRNVMLNGAWVVGVVP